MTHRQVFTGLAFLAALALGGCSYWRSMPSYSVGGGASADSVRGQCERAAYDDPEMKAAVANEAAAAGYNQQQALIDLAKVKRRVVDRCLKRHGVRDTGGGVERPVR